MPDGTDAHPLTDSPGRDLYRPLWSPDGLRIALGISDDRGIRSDFLDIDRPLGEIRDPLRLAGQEINNLALQSWSPDGRWIIGSGFDRSGESASVLHDQESGESFLLHTPEPGYHEAASGRHWLDDNRFVFWDWNHRAAYLWDVAAGRSREVTGIPGPCQLVVIDEGRALIANRFRTEADIWMLSLGEPVD